MSSAAIETLFYVFDKNLLPRPEPGARVLFMNAQYHVGLEGFPKDTLVLQQCFQPHYAALEARGYKAGDDIPEDNAQGRSFDLAFIALPKNRIEAAGLVAQALDCLADDGILLCAAENKAGGTRIKKMMQSFGLEISDDVSKHKSRAVWAYKNGCDDGAVKRAIQGGAFQNVLAADYVSRPGIFGWDKIDKGSALLAQNLPDDLKGHGADFGCGYGYLSRHVLSCNPAIRSLVCIDADSRAVEAARRNLASSECDVRYIWADLTKPAGLERLDFIVMNPPFHEGKKADSDIGVLFIKTAARSLKKNGTLWMVANNQLPYEEVLAQEFFHVEKISQGQGFKVFKAVR